MQDPIGTYGGLGLVFLGVAFVAGGLLLASLQQTAVAALLGVGTVLLGLRAMGADDRLWWV